ncbi:MAG: flagellar protein FlaG [Deferribacteres bacterium]|nr:flagellar protein FlaG [candidate division KSB1 bacterium]MCB9504194.1 flagellar protein FlaG [Deferribacteres bacterium]
MNQIEISNSISRTLPLPSVDNSSQGVKEQASKIPAPEKVEIKQKTSGSNEVSENARQENLSMQELQKEIEKANALLKESNARHLSFFVDDETGKQGVRVVDTQTDEVIRQFPPEETLNIAARIREQLGALVDQVA